MLSARIVLGQDLRDTADAINRRATDIASLASVESWQSKAADAFRDAASDAVAQLRKAFHRYDVASRALGTQSDSGDAYAAVVTRTQAAADKALRNAQNADAEFHALQHQIDQLPHGTPDTDPLRISLTRGQQTAQDDLARTRAAVQRAKEDHQNAGRAAAAAVRRAITHDGLHDSLIDKAESDVGDVLDATGNFLEDAGYELVSDLASVGNAMINDPKATGELLGGALLTGVGGAAETFGVGVSATGVGAIGGVPITALAASAVTIGAGAMADATISLAEDAAGPDQYTMERSDRGGNSSPQPAPKELKAFPDVKRAKPKTPVQGGGGLRKRWVGKDGSIYEWDSQHGTVEKYNKRGNHLGEFDPETGEETKPADPSRKVTP